MAEVATNQQVPLDTIPISPEEPHDGNGGAASSGGNGNDYSEQNPITVFHDSSNFNVKHPLMNKWTLWFTKPPSGKVHQQSRFSFYRLLPLCIQRLLFAFVRYLLHAVAILLWKVYVFMIMHIDTDQTDNWNELLKQVISFDSVEEFWGIYVSFLLLAQSLPLKPPVTQKPQANSRQTQEQHLSCLRTCLKIRLPPL